MTLLLIIGLLVGGWSFLALLGNERQRRVQQLHSSTSNLPEASVAREVVR